MALIVQTQRGLLNGLGSGGNTGLGFIEVEIGTTEATDLGLIDGETRFTDPAMIYRYVMIHRNNIILPSISWAGGTYFTKAVQNAYFDFSEPLHDEELIRIQLI